LEDIPKVAVHADGEVAAAAVDQFGGIAGQFVPQESDRGYFD
jgi:hypothetical protein